MKNNTLFKNFSWNLIGSLIYAFTQYLIVIIIGRFGSPELLGLYSLGLAITAPLMMFTNLKLRSVQSTGYAFYYGFYDFMNTRILGNVLFITILFYLLVMLKYDLSTMIVIGLLAFSKIIESFSDLFYGKLQFNERLDYVGKSLIIRGLFGLTLFSVIFLLTNSLEFSIAGLILAWLINLIFYDRKNGMKFLGTEKFNLNIINIKQIFLLSLPLGILALLTSLNTNIPRIIIDANLTLTDLGYFTSVFYLTIILGKFVISLGASFLPRLSKYYESNLYIEHLKLSLKFFVLVLIMSVFLILTSYIFGDVILYILYGKEYEHLNDLLLLTMIYGLINYSLYVLRINLESSRIFKPQLYVEILNVSLTILFTLILVPSFGLDGAVYSLIISSIISFIILLTIIIVIYIKLKSGVKNK